MRKFTYFILFTLFLTSCQPKPTANEYFEMGLEYYGNELDSLAIVNFSKAIELQFSYKDAYYYRGFANHRAGNFDAAILDYSKTIELDGQNYEAYYFRGVVKRNLNNTHSAYTDYSKAIEINPKFDLAYYNRAMIEFDLGMQDSACADLQIAKMLNNPKADSAILVYCQ